MTYRASWDLAPSRPFLALNVLATISLLPKCSGLPLPQDFAPALPSTGMLSSSPPTGSLSLMSQLMGHLVRSQAPLLQALWSTYSCFIFFFLALYPVWLFSSSLHNQKGKRCPSLYSQLREHDKHTAGLKLHCCQISVHNAGNNTC